MIRLIDLPGVREIENAALLQSYVRGVDHEWEARLDRVSRALFDITEAEATPAKPRGSYLDDPDAWDAYGDLWERLRRADLSGWDFKDDRGREMLVAGRFVQQIRAVVSGVGGKMPDLEAAKRESAFSKLEADKERFLSERRKARRNGA